MTSKTNVIHFRLTDKQTAKLKAVADVEEVSVSDLCRRALLNAMRRYDVGGGAPEQNTESDNEH